MTIEVQRSFAECLTPEEQSAWKEFLKLCDDHGLLLRPGELQPGDTTHGLNDEATLLRFLKGRSFIPNDALRQLEDARDIRQSVSAIETYDNVNISVFENARKMYPHWTGHRTRRGLPICFFDINHLGSTTTSNYAKSRNNSHGCKNGSTEATKLAIVYHDYLTRFVLPFCSELRDRPEPHLPITSAVYLVDVGTLTLRQGWSLRSYAQDVSKLLATCYPEVVDRVYVLNASSYFGKVWGFLSKWIDPRTASKLVIVPSTEMKPVLESEIDVDCIPSQFGGNCEFKHGMPPQVDRSTLESLEIFFASGKVFPLGPVKWVLDEDGIKTALGVGMDGGKLRKLPVAKATKASS